MNILSTKIELLYSGNEDGFYQFEKFVNTSIYEFKISVLDVKNLNSLDRESLEFILTNQKKIATKITPNSINYLYKGINVYYLTNQKNDVLGVFAMGEMQPLRYVIYSLAYFTYGDDIIHPYE